MVTEAAPESHNDNGITLFLPLAVTITIRACSWWELHVFEPAVAEHAGSVECRRGHLADPRGPGLGQGQHPERP